MRVCLNVLENASGSVEAGVIDAKGPATCTAQAFSDGDPTCWRTHQDQSKQV